MDKRQRWQTAASAATRAHRVFAEEPLWLFGFGGEDKARPTAGRLALTVDELLQRVLGDDEVTRLGTGRFDVEQDEDGWIRVSLTLVVCDETGRMVE